MAADRELANAPARGMVALLRWPRELSADWRLRGAWRVGRPAQHQRTAVRPTVVTMAEPDGIERIRRTNVSLWLAVVCFAYYYKAFFCGLLGHQLGLRFLCFTWIHGISTNHWFEIIVYCPLLWLALHQINADVFGILPADPSRHRRTFRHQLIGEFADRARDLRHRDPHRERHRDLRP